MLRCSATCTLQRLAANAANTTAPVGKTHTSLNQEAHPL